MTTMICLRGINSGRLQTIGWRVGGYTKMTIKPLYYNILHKHNYSICKLLLLYYDKSDLIE